MCYLGFLETASERFGSSWGSTEQQRPLGLLGAAATSWNRSPQNVDWCTFLQFIDVAHCRHKAYKHRQLHFPDSSRRSDVGNCSFSSESLKTSRLQVSDGSRGKQKPQRLYFLLMFSFQTYRFPCSSRRQLLGINCKIIPPREQRVFRMTTAF